MFQRNRRTPCRRGATAVEFAVAAPILILFTFAGIEFSRVNSIRNTMENAAYEGARRGVVPGATAAACQATAQNLLDVIQVNDSSVTVNPATISPDTDTITVTVSVPLSAANGYVTPQYYLGQSLQTSITLPRERE